VRIAPKPQFGEDQIKLEPLEGQIVAVYVRGRKTADTKFGERQVTSIRILSEKSDEPLDGAVFQSYFQTLEMGQWYVGRLELEKVGRFRAWVLVSDNLPKASVAKLEKLADRWSPASDDVPF
jgi:hypothetical protein